MCCEVGTVTATYPIIRYFRVTSSVRQCYHRKRPCTKPRCIILTADHLYIVNRGPNYQSTLISIIIRVVVTSNYFPPVFSIAINIAGGFPPTMEQMGRKTVFPSKYFTSEKTVDCNTGREMTAPGVQYKRSLWR